jgi:hypothetical protein
MLYDDLTFVIVNGTVTITGYTGPGGDVAIPDRIDGLPVTAVGDQAFESHASVTGVTIPDSVVRIGDEAFKECGRLTGVVIGNSVTAIGEEAFMDCASLTTVDMSNSVIRIWDSAFAYCTSLASIAIPDSTVALGVVAFRDCASLTSVEIPGSVTSIGDEAFEGCTALTCITIPESVTSVGDYSFFDSAELESVLFLGNVPSHVGEYVFAGADQVIIYYLCGAPGWGPIFAGRPAVRAIYLALPVPTPPPGEPFTITVCGPVGSTVHLQRSVDLVDWEDWKTLALGEEPTGVEDSDFGSTTYRFYRALKE